MIMCYRPIPIKDPSGKTYRTVPCGRCLECLKATQNSWSIRMYEELKSHSFKGVFFTLTYNEDTVPKNLVEDGQVYRSEPGYHYKEITPYSSAKIVHIWNDLDKCGKKAFMDEHRNNPPEDAVVFNSVRKKDVQDWIKRNRKSMPKDFAYFICAEYGPSTLRPHYHGCFFGVTKDQCVHIFNDWRDKFGFVTLDNIDLSKGGVAYCAKYCCKGVYQHPFCAKDFFYWKDKETPIVEETLDEDGILRARYTEYHSKHYERCLEYFGMDEPLVDVPFRLMSKGLGDGFLRDSQNQAFHMFGRHNELQYEIRPIPVAPDGSIVTDIRETSGPSWSQRLGFNLQSHKSIRTDRYDHSRYIERSYTNKGATRFGSFTYGDDPFLYDGPGECDFSTTNVKYTPVFCLKDYFSTDFSKVGDIYIQNRLYDCLEILITRNKYMMKSYGNKSKTQGTSVYALAVPRFYYEKMYGKTLRDALSQVVSQNDVDLYNEQFRQLRSADPTREDFEILLDMEEEKARQKADRVRLAFERTNKQYSKSKL